MGEWKEYRLDEIAEILDYKRKPLSSMQRSVRKGEIPYYGASGIIDYIDDYIFEGEHVLISEDGENLRSRQTPIAFLAGGKFWVNNHAHIIKSDYIHNRLICYYFANFDLNPFLTGAVQPKLSQDSLMRIPIFLPKSIEDRKQIVSIIASVDDKIDLLYQENKTLEAMAETLFRKWFIEEVRHEVSLGDVVETTSGGTPSRKCEEYYQNGIIDWVKSKELNRSFLLKTEEKITVEAVENSSAKFLPANSVLIAMYGATVGEYAIIAKEMTCNQAVCALKPNDNYPYTYLYLWAKFMQDEFLNLACGAAQQNISQVLIKQQPVCSDVNAVKQFHSIVEPFFEKLKQNEIQLSSLEEMKNVILSKLMNNE